MSETRAEAEARRRRTQRAAELWKLSEPDREAEHWGDYGDPEGSISTGGGHD